MPSGYTNVLECPRGCKGQGGKPIAATIRGWKKHMTRNHREYTEEELAAVVGAVPPDSERGRELFLSEAGDTTELPPQEPRDPEAEAEAKRVVNLDKTSKRLTGKLNKTKEKLAGAVPRVLNVVLKEKAPDMVLTDSEQKEVADSMEEVFEMLDVTFAVEPYAYVLQSRLWALLIPLATVLAILGVKAAEREKDDKETANQE